MSLIWPGPQSVYLLNRLTKFISDNYPSVKNPFQIARNLEEDTRKLLSQNRSMVDVDNEVYYVGDISDLLIELLIRSGNDEVFPNLLINSYGLANIKDEGSEELLDIIVSTIEYHVKQPLITKINETWNSKTYQIYVVKKAYVLVENFDRNRLGIFLYLMYMRDLFKENKEVCVIISDLAPLIKRCMVLEQELGMMDREAFLLRNSKYKEDYESLYELYKKKSIAYFRFVLLNLLLADSGPYLQVIRDEQTNDLVEVRNSRSFEILMNRCEQSGARYTVSFLIMSDYKKAHANIVIIDRKMKTIERYEPNGYLSDRVSLGRTRRNLLGDISEKADDVLHELSRKLGYKYEPPMYFCPKYGIQQIELHFEKTVGYCVTWSILYGIERLQSGLPKEQIAANFIDILVDRYALEGITEKEKAKSIEALLAAKVAAIFADMDLIYTELSTALGVKVKYEQGKLVYFS